MRGATKETETKSKSPAQRQGTAHAGAIAKRDAFLLFAAPSRPALPGASAAARMFACNVHLGMREHGIFDTLHTAIRSPHDDHRKPQR
jgi:hypothetical protein